MRLSCGCLIELMTGGKRLFMAFWVLLHVLAFGLALVHYTLKDNLVNARGTFGWTFSQLSIMLRPGTNMAVAARGSAQVLHSTYSALVSRLTSAVDVIFILSPVCRNFISLLRRTPLNDIIPFDKNITFHKQVAWAIVFFSVIHIVSLWRPTQLIPGRAHQQRQTFGNCSGDVSDADNHGRWS